MGGGGGGDTSVTQTVANPTVPKGFEGFANSLRLIGAGLMSNPNNMGPIPSLDAPRSGPLIPNASLGTLASSPAFMMGANRMNPMAGQNNFPQAPLAPRPAFNGVPAIPPPTSNPPTGRGPRPDRGPRPPREPRPPRGTRPPR